MTKIQNKAKVANQILSALSYLSSVCDGAYERDDNGFNKFDATFGHDLAQRDQLTSRQEAAATKMLQKYRKQLLSAGIEIPTMIEYEGINNQSSRAVPKIHESAYEFQIKFGKHNGKSLGKIIETDRGYVKWLAEKSYTPSVKSAAKAALAGEPIDSPAEEPKTSSVKISLENGYVKIRFSARGDKFSERLEKVRSLPERKYRAKDSAWVAPNRLAGEIIDMFPDADITADVNELISMQKKLADMSNKSDSDFEIPGLKGEPFPFQRAGINFIEIANGRGIIADEMGLGKTLQSLAYLQLHPEKRPAIIVVPASLKINWRIEIEKWLTTDETVVILNGRKAKALPPASIYIINYDIVKAWLPLLISSIPQVLIVDEAHYCKNQKAARSKAVQTLAKKIEHVILLTGTPITNRPAELFPLLNMIDPAAWPNFFKFAMRYCNAHDNGYGWDFSGASNSAELHKKIRPYVIRRKKSQVLTELPKKQRVVVEIPITNKSRVEYDKFMADAIKAIHESGKVSAIHLTMIEKAKQAAVRGKMTSAIEWIENALDTDKKLVIFCTHNWTVDRLIEKFGKAAVKITGSVNQAARQDAVDRFQNDDSVKLFIGNIKAAGVGLTLTAASDVVFLELAWTPGDHAQAEDRCHRIGQRDSVAAWYLLASDTIDEKIFSLLEEKREVIDAVVDGEDGELKFKILEGLAKGITKTGEK